MCAVLDVGMLGGQAYQVMELVDGRTLHIAGRTAVELLHCVRDLGHDTAFVVLSANPDSDTLIETFRLRVHEFVLKFEDTAPFLDAVLSATSAHRAAARIT